jgi:hypothetical protein
MPTPPTTDITLFGPSPVADLTKDLTKRVHLPSPACFRLHPAAFPKKRLAPDFTGISCVSRWNLTSCGFRRMSALSRNDDTGSYRRLALVSLGFVIPAPDLTAICPVRRLTQFQISKL